MTEKKSIFAELIERRIPQILGVYVASVWLAVEVSEWMTERFDVPDQTSSYVFVIMIAFLPLVGLLAWGHGRPGKDKWTQKQIIFIPFNVAIAWFAVNSFIKPEVLPEQIDTDQVTEIMALTDVQTGEVIEYEVAKSGMSQNVVGFFWENKTGNDSLDWLSYGSMWMVAKDLMRNPIISIRTPYDSVSMMGALTSKGFERAVGEPLALGLDVSSDRDAKWMIRGQITEEAGKLTFEAMLYDVLTGAMVKTISSTFDDWLFALDDVAEQLADVILDQANIQTNIVPKLPLSESLSNNLTAIESVINSLNAVKIDNDFVEGVAQLENALQEDEQLAEAYVLMLDFYRAMGDVEAAQKAGEAALKLEYKLDSETALKVKANYYAAQGDIDKAIRVLENWVKLSPESADALMILGRNYIIVGNRLDDALKVYQKLSELQESNATALVNQARIYRLKDNQEMALKALELYAKSDPDKESPWLEKAATYLQFGDLEKAKENFEEASLLSFNKISADLGLAKLMAYQGEVDEGLQAMDALIEKSETDTAKVQILAEKEIVLYTTGRVKEALEVVKTAKTLSASYMVPVQYQLTYGPKEASYLAYLQDYQGAWEKLAEVKGQVKPPFDNFLGMVELTIHELTGDDEKLAIKLTEFEQFIQTMNLNIYDQFIISWQAILARKAGDYETAIELHDRAINESKQSFFTLETIALLDDLIHKKAETLFEMGQYDETLESLDVVMKRNPLLGQVKLLAAKAHIELKQYDQAQQLVDDVKKLWFKADSGFKHLEDLQIVEAQLSEIIG
jgi:tetratricopeptide (TPR) repeat protein